MGAAEGFLEGKWKCELCRTWLSNETYRCANGHALSRITGRVELRGQHAVWVTDSGGVPRWCWEDDGGLLKHVCQEHSAKARTRKRRV